MVKPKIITRQIFVDDRGSFEPVSTEIVIDKEKTFKAKRVYVCANHEAGIVRGFHYHAKEEKVFVVLKGAVRFILLKGTKSDPEIDMSNDPAKSEFYLSDRNPQLLYVPNDYANAWQTLTDDAILMGLSNVTVDESIKDDIRFSPTCVSWETIWR
jgi:dTDP-4-dehydrorhamnose 3,5-epimerase-like enzyme